MNRDLQKRFTVALLKTSSCTKRYPPTLLSYSHYMLINFISNLDTLRKLLYTNDNSLRNAGVDA